MKFAEQNVNEKKVRPNIFKSEISFRAVRLEINVKFVAK